MAKVVIHTNKARVTISIIDNWNLGSGLTLELIFLEDSSIASFFFHGILSLDPDQIACHSQVLPFKY